MSRFDPRPDQTYAACEDCDAILQTRPDVSAHFEATMPKGGKSHRVRITNPSRSERIEQALDSLADDALYQFVNDANDLLSAGVTEEEISEAVKQVVVNFADAWESRND